MQMVDAWIARGKDYNEGLKVLEDAGASEFMLELLSSGPDEYNTPKLQQEILSLKSATPEAQADHHTYQAPVAVGLEKAEAPTYVPNHDLEKTIRIKEQIKQLFKEIGHLKPQLVLLPTRLKRYECAREIATRDMRRQDLWEHLHYFEEHGKWFDELPENQPKPFDLERAIKNEMANRSKASAFLDKPLTVVKKAYYEAKVAAHTRKIENLKSLRP